MDKRLNIYKSKQGEGIKGMTYPIALGVRARKVDFAIKDLTLELHVGGRPCWINVRDSEVQRGTVERNGVLVPGPPPMLGVARELAVGGGRGPGICPLTSKSITGRKVAPASTSIIVSVHLDCL